MLAVIGGGVVARSGLLLALTLAGAACSAAQHPASDTACALSAADSTWVDRALNAWRLSRAEITGIAVSGPVRTLFFDAHCGLTSDNALSAADGRDVRWSAVPHGGSVPLPDGDEIPPVVTSFAGVEDGRAYFVMSTPSVWRAGGVVGDPLDLETLMVFVLLHEAAHVVQAPTYGQSIGAIAERYALPEDITDDTMQEDFGNSVAFSTSVRREIELFLEAATSADDGDARRLAGEAREMMRARATRFFTGDHAHYNELEAVWLTFEGSGQWAGYQWLIHPRGMNVDPELARRAAMRSRWWSQNEGLAIALTLDRIGPENWRDVAFGDGSRTLLDMLDEALASP